jgi:hypothetical protein
MSNGRETHYLRRENFTDSLGLETILVANSDGGFTTIYTKPIENTNASIVMYLTSPSGTRTAANVEVRIGVFPQKHLPEKASDPNYQALCDRISALTQSSLVTPWDNMGKRIAQLERDEQQYAREMPQR